MNVSITNNISAIRASRSLALADSASHPDSQFTGERVIPGQVNADLWAEHFARYAFARRFAPGQRVLDAGCGAGYGAAELSLDAKSVVGIDLSRTVVAHARTVYPLPNLHFAAASCTCLPFPDASFDLITVFEVIEHLKDYRSLIAECARVLAPGGAFLVSTPNRDYYAETREQVGPNPYHEHEFEAREFQEELRTAFPRVTLLLQNRLEAIAFHPAKSLWAADARIDSGGGQESDAHFFLAICAKDRPSEERAFVYVPKAANILKERERHVQSLLRQVAEARENHRRVLGELEAHNLWARELDRELDQTRETVAQYQSQVTELEAENLRKTEWARATEQRLTADIAAHREKLQECVRLLDERQETIDERTRWAQTEAARREQLERQLAMVRDSRWVKLGRQLRVGPEIEQS